MEEPSASSVAAVRNVDERRCLARRQSDAARQQGVYKAPVCRRPVFSRHNIPVTGENAAARSKAKRCPHTRENVNHRASRAPRVRVQAGLLYSQGAICGTLTVSNGQGWRHGQRCSAGQQDITDSERRRCRKASGGPGQHSAAARLCGEGVWSLETMGGVDLPQDHTQRGAEPYNFSEPHRCMSGARGPTGARTTKAQVISL